MSTKKARILVIEDHLLAQKIAQSILNDLNCEVDIAENGNKAFELLNENTYHLVFVDLGLPDFDGCTVTAKIRANQKTRSLPVIGLSVHATPKTKNEALESGMNSYIVKPLTIENCKAILKEFVTTTADLNKLTAIA